MRGPDDYFLCINAGNVAKDLAWIREQSSPFAVTITDRSDDYALLAVQGPRAAEIVQSLTGAKLGLVQYYHVTEGTVAGIHCLISRTGYTGEDGFELYHAAGDAVALAEAVLAAGAPRGLELAGLGARDSLRLEAGYPLYGHEITQDISPLTAGLGWTVKLDKGADFIGRDALVAEKKNGAVNKVVFFKTGDRRIVRAETPVLGANGTIVGRVLSGTLSPLLNESIGSALVTVAAAREALVVDIRGTKLNLHLVKPPFVELKKATQ
jgi:aminomethyltransferase